MTRLNRRAFLQTGLAATIGAIPATRSFASVQPRFDLLIRGGNLLDGTGNPAYPADIGIIGDRIAAIGTISPAQGQRVIEAGGKTVTPGFIDIHTHSDDSILVYPNADSRIHQGVTTEVTGNCGSSEAPAPRATEDERARRLEEEAGVHLPYSNVDSYLSALSKRQIAVNQALLLGQGSIREMVAGPDDRELSADELKQVLRIVEEGLEQGAFGISTGLEYTPGRFTPTDEIVAMARVTARYGALYASHIRNEELRLLEAIAEAIHIGRSAGVRVEISHFKAAGRMNWDKQGPALDLIEAARRSGIEVLADAYPYPAYSTGLSIFLSSWVLDGGWEKAEERLKDPASVSKVISEIGQRVKQDPGGFDRIVLSRLREESQRDFIGKHVEEIAAGWRISPAEATVRLLLENQGSIGFVGFGMSESNVEQALAHPLVMIGSDGSSMAPTGPAAGSRPHPRSYGAFPRVLSHFVREQKVMDLPTAIKKMTSLPADQVGLKGRGRIARGMFADLVVFDPESIRDEATFEDPHQFASGIQHVLVNGKSVIEDGKSTGNRPGLALRRG
ncbi:MAG: D-aminoacylase [Acidobacteriota bacterium]|nr:MAG: D-aminoacylase [Acidobacteriota bacterium]